MKVPLVQAFATLLAVLALALPCAADDDAIYREIKKLGGKVPTWNVVDFKGTQVKDDDLKLVAKLKNLAMLRLTDTDITDEGLAHLRGLKKLKHLDLNGARRITDDGLRELTDLTNLEELYLSKTKITGSGFQALTKLKKVNHLGLRDTQITNASLPHLRALEGLEILDLKGTQIHSTGLHHLRGLPNLSLLIVSETRITDGGLTVLHSRQDFPKLRTLDALKTQVTVVGAEALKAARGGEIIVAY
jgi:Leucine-rich repeat (LRR) protein